MNSVVLVISSYTHLVSPLQYMPLVHWILFNLSQHNVGFGERPVGGPYIYVHDLHSLVSVPARNEIV